MKLNLLIIGIILFFQISTLTFTNYKQICQDLVVNKRNKCKQKFTSINQKKRSTCVCRDMNVKLDLSNSTLQALKNIKNDFLELSIYFKNKHPTILGEQLTNFHQVIKNISMEKNVKNVSMYRTFYSTFNFVNVKGFEMNSF